MGKRKATKEPNVEVVDEQENRSISTLLVEDTADFLNKRGTSPHLLDTTSCLKLEYDKSFSEPTKPFCSGHSTESFRSSDFDRERETNENKIPNGLKNPGGENLCYVNSCLQALAATKPLKNYLLTGEYRNELSYKSGSYGQVIKSLDIVLVDILINKDSPAYAKGFKKIVGCYSQEYSDYEQKDASLFLQALLYILIEETSSKLMKSSIEDIFQMILKYNTQSSICGFESRVQCSMNVILIHIQRGIRKINDLIILSFQAETIYDYECQVCRKTITVQREQEIIQLPKILILQLMRFRYNGLAFEKDDTPLEIEEEIRVPDDKGEKYNLYAIIKHRGSLEHGHYFTHIKSKDKWLEANDRSVTATSLTKMCSLAYLLFYAKK